MGLFSSTGQGAQSNKPEQYTEVNSTQLKTWYEQGKEMIVVDARSKPYYDGTLLPNAIWLPYDVSGQELQNKLPNKNSLVVVYCWSPQCPASHYLVDRLVAEGYTNVYKYPAGLQEWIQKGLSVDKK